MLEKTPSRKSKVAAETGGDVAGERIVITAPRMATREFLLIGTAPFVSNNFAQEQIDIMAETMTRGSQAKKGKKREPKNFEKDYRGSMHVSTEGWVGHPASTFRQAMVRACAAVGFKMTLAKMGIFIIPDGFDHDTGAALVKIHGEPEMRTHYVKLANGKPDIKARGFWPKWSMRLRVEFDEDMFSSGDIANLLMRVGKQVGIGAGRHFSTTSCGQGWGTFKLAEADEQ